MVGKEVSPCKKEVKGTEMKGDECECDKKVEGEERKSGN